MTITEALKRIDELESRVEGLIWENGVNRDGAIMYEKISKKWCLDNDKLQVKLDTANKRVEELERHYER